MIKAILLLAALTAVFLILYDQGYMVINSKTAASYIGSARGTGARFTSCSGSVKRIVRFKADGTYTFLLNAALSKGDMSVELLNSARESIMHLDPAHPTATVAVEQKKKYYLITRFKTATGSFSLIRE
ncbi:MAG: hypothetical protein IKD27_02460 [Oscillospiraceae bacterium]|nr:hypothetical protein [Oscillospiraceae bacterium]